ncbi:DUF6468 domain-containing protein [Kordiimonas pumila]|uniref:DUF6468 domain-containing protein n=1 Tax=Kordiimonas pumila TaxID=2161677 RepID=A0ABV7D2H6_9PROT|nr:DUF6468 domain-containing protein [Kordiimonas pumila]
MTGSIAIPELIVDSVLAVLLFAVIIVCLIVYRKLSVIKEGQTELRDLVDRLNTAVFEAQRSVGTLGKSASDIEGRLKVEVQKASAIADELSLITEAGNNLADRIEKGLTQGDGKPAIDKGTNKKQQEEILAALREAR